MILPSWTKFIIFPLLGAFLGFVTNWLAITLLFRPRKKIFGIVGLLQKRKPTIAKKAGEVIREYLLNTKELKKVMDKEKVKISIEKLVDNTLKTVPSIGRKMFSKALREITYKYFFDDDGFVKEEILELALSDADVEKIIIEKIMDYDISEIEKIIKKASGVEILFILCSGGVLGIIIGLIQALIPF